MIFGVVAVVVVGYGGWWMLTPAEEPPTLLGTTDAPAPTETLAVVDQDDDASDPNWNDVKLVADEYPDPSKHDAPLPASDLDVVDQTPSPTPTDLTIENVNNDDDASNDRMARAGKSDNPAIETARQLIADGKLVAARERLNRMLRSGPDEAVEDEVRSLLTHLADETIFSARVLPSDPLVDRYTVESGDVLINIGKKFRVPDEVIQSINNISNPRAIRAGQRLKVPRGPFHAKIDKSAFRLDVYLGDTYLRSYRVALGTENGTPEGVWKVKNRLENPTYYPPASAPDKRIIPGNDPENPLGERWIGLEGIKGDAVGRGGYGIHGTIEPETIGQAVSMGCVRMHNDEVAFLYRLLMPGYSTVTIVP